MSKESETDLDKLAKECMKHVKCDAALNKIK